MLKKFIMVGIGIGLVFTLLAQAVTGGDSVAPSAPAAALPTSLDAFYPPRERYAGIPVCDARDVHAAIWYHG